MSAGSRREGDALRGARKRQAINELQRAIAREFAARTDVPKTMPERLTDLVRELHHQLRRVDQAE